MPAEERCPQCQNVLSRPRMRVMPDGVSEYLCPDCDYQIPLLVPGQTQGIVCPLCSAAARPPRTVRGVDQSGLLNLVACQSCGCVLGRYWGLL